MAKEGGNTLQTVCLTVGIFLITTVFVGGGMLVYQYRDASIDLSPEALLSKDDLKAIKNPQSANKEAWDKMSREAWERSQAQQPKSGSYGGWKK